MKTIHKIVIFTIILTLSILISFFIIKNILSNSNTTKTSTTDESSNFINELEKEQESIKNKNYYLHDSDLDYPTQEQCTIYKENALIGLNDNEKNEISNAIKRNHMHIERLLLDHISILKDPNSPYWPQFTQEGIFEEPGHPETKVEGGDFLLILKQLKSISDTVQNELVKQDFKEACNLLQQGIDNHDVEKFFEAHKIIHDYDYWICNPYVFLQIEPPDWEGAYTFFNKASIIE